MSSRCQNNDLLRDATPAEVEKILSSVGLFSWSFGMQFFVETPVGNFVWKDPDYYGDNSFVQFDGSHNDFIGKIGIQFSRDKGRHFVRDYCGESISIKILKT